MNLNWPLMENNITRQDLTVLIEFLKSDPILTQSQNVRDLEKEWSEWLGVKYSVFVNSGASANFILDPPSRKENHPLPKNSAIRDLSKGPYAPP